MACSRGIARPEHIAGSGRDYYNENEAHRYDSTLTTNIIQKELTLKALQLLGIQEGDRPLIADIGCGSGLSSAILTEEGLPWVGTDISLPMLHLAQQREQCQGHVAIADMAQGLPLRSGAFDFAISISAVQWLCVHERPVDAAETFFRAVLRCLKPNGKAAFQIYLENDNQRRLLLSAASSVGFLAMHCVDFPHRSAAKKYYILLSKTEKLETRTEKHRDAGFELSLENNSTSTSCRGTTTTSSTTNDITTTSTITPLNTTSTSSTTTAVPLHQRCCNLAWPAEGSCILSWSHRHRHIHTQQPHLPQRNNSESIGARARQEHISVGKRMLRVLRHACRDTPGVDSWPPLPTINNNSSTRTPLFLHPSLPRSIIELDISVEQGVLVPCGGPLVVHLSISSELYSSSSFTPALYSSEGRTATATTIFSENGTEVVNGNGSLIFPDAAKGGAAEGLSREMRALLQHLIGCSEAEAASAECISKSTLNAPSNKENLGKLNIEEATLTWPEFLHAAAAAAEEESEAIAPKEVGTADESSTTNGTADSTTTNSTTNPIHKSSSRNPYFYLEHLQVCSTNNNAHSRADQLRGASAVTPLALSILHATKPALPELLIIPSFHIKSDPLENSIESQLAEADGTSLNIQQWGSLGPAVHVQRLSSLCAQYNGCVVGLDAVVDEEKVSCAWLVYVPGLQTMERGAVMRSWGGELND